MGEVIIIKDIGHFVMTTNEFEEEVYIAVPGPGQSELDQAADLSIRLAKHLGIIVRMKFNQVTVTVSAGTSVEEIVENYRRIVKYMQGG